MRAAWGGGSAAHVAPARVAPPARPLACGDAIVFPSEMRHNVSTLRSGERRAFIMELWEGPANTHNRHS